MGPEVAAVHKEIGGCPSVLGQALDAIGPGDQPLHVARFGAKFDAQGVLAGSKDSGRCIRYLTKYLTKHLSGCHQADTDAQHDHAQQFLLRVDPYDPSEHGEFRDLIETKLRLEIRYESIYGGEGFTVVYPRREWISPPPAADGGT
jgi:hypothetical protein